MAAEATGRRGTKVNETHFWGALEYRLCREFAGLPERRYQYFWCDGFIAEEYDLAGPSPRITGRCWICNGQRQAEWEFALILPAPAAAREEIDWESLLPGEGMTKWMAFDEDRKYIEIEPAVAVRDLS